MTAAVFNLQAKAHNSRVLAAHTRTMRDARDSGAMQPLRAAGENTVQTNYTAEQLANLLGASTATHAGVSVTEDIAMRVATVYACVGLIAGAIATLPMHIYERAGNERRRSEGHEYWWMLNEQPCDGYSAATAWETLMMNKLVYGDGIARILRPSQLSSRAIGWKPYHRHHAQPYRAADKSVRYRFYEEDGTIIDANQADVIHLPSLGFDGVSSPSPITHYARETIGALLAAERFSSKVFTSGGTFDFALKTPAKLSKDQADALLASITARSAADPGTRVPLILSGGLESAGNISMAAKDTEIMAARLFGVQEICRMYGVPPSMVGHTDKTTSWGSGIEHLGIGFVRYTLQRHLTSIAQEFNRKLWPVRARYFVEHLTAALERGDLKTRFEAYRIAVGRAGEQGWMSADEVRRIENMPPGENLSLNNPNPGGANAQPSDPAAG
jgi:HK97 family phage portal protein